MKRYLICVLLFFVLLFSYMALWDLLKQAPIAAIGRAIQSWNQPQQQQATPTTSTQGFSSGFVGGSVGGGGGGGGGGSLVKNAKGQLVPAPSSGGGGGSSWNNGGGGDTELQMLEKMDRNPIQERRYQELRGYQAPRPAPRPAPQTPTTPPKPQTFDMGAFQRKMSDMASSVGQKASSTLGSAGSAIASGGGKMLGAIGRAITPNVYAEGMEPTQKKGFDLRKFLGTGIENIGTNLGLPEFKFSENVAGGATPLTGQTASSAKVFSPSRFTPEERIGATSEKTGLGFTPGEASNLVGTQTLDRTPPSLGGGGAGSVLGLSDVTFASLVEEIMSPSAYEQIAQMPMEDLDAAYTRMAEELGVTKQQAVLNDLNTQVLEVTDSLESIDKDVTAESGDVLMTEGQRRRLVESRSRPLREQLVKLMRSAQYAGVGLDNLMGMLKDRMGAKQQTVTNQFQASQQAQSAEEERKKRLLGILPYVQPKAKALSSKSSGGEFDLESLLG